MKIVVIGTGYVGLVSGTCFAESGNSVTCVDVNESKIAQLSAGQIPIYEPGLDSMVVNNQKAGRLSFTSNLGEALQQAVFVFIAVGTPQDEDGSADMQYVLAAAREIGMLMQEKLIVVVKSTVPVGTNDRVRATIADALQERGVDIPFDVASNPEFLKEGSAIKDFMGPDRVVVGANSEETRNMMHELYRHFMRRDEKILFMSPRDAELTKYAANAMLATKISFINEIANIAERVGADIEHVRLGMGADERIGYHFLYPGCGYGGSCFPKDVSALLKIAKDNHFDPLVLNAVTARNKRQKSVLFDKLSQFFEGDLVGKQIALWGLAFKPGTDDIREASSLTLIDGLLEAGAVVHAHDPVAMENVSLAFAGKPGCDRLHFFDEPYAALDHSDALVLVTEWQLYRQPDFGKNKQKLRVPLLLDGRNQYNPERKRALGFVYSGIGR